MRTIVAALGAALLLGGCIQSSSDDEAKPSPSPTADAPKAERFASLAKLLTVSSTKDCMFRKRIPLDQATIRRLGILEWLEEHVQSDRQLDFDVSLSDLRLLDGLDFERAVDQVGTSSPPKDEDRMRLLSWALGLAPHGVDVNLFLGGNEADLIAGLYNPKNGDVIIRSKSKERASPRGVVVLTHELAHAATDQRFGLRVKSGEILDDAALAYRSAVEGDASLVEFRFLSRFSPKKAMKKAIRGQLRMEKRLGSGSALGVPEVVSDAGVFPYQWGFGFACAIYKEQGWQGINKMYRNRPPETTAQVMFPQRYLAREKAVKPRPLPDLSKPWLSIASGTMGAAHLKSLFEAPGNISSESLSKPVGRAASWAGGIWELWRGNGERYGSVGIALVEHERYPGLLCASMREWYEASFPEAEALEATETLGSYADDVQSTVIECDGAEVRIGISPDGEVAEALVK